MWSRFLTNPLSATRFSNHTRRMLHKILNTDKSKITLIIRLMVGVVFVSEGLQKFIFPMLRGAGRFEGIGLPAPEFLGYFVGSFEVLCGTLVLLGLFTRLASIPLLVIMTVALLTTKLEIFMEKGFWIMMHAARTDWAMWLGSLFLLFSGGGRWSLDKRWFSNHNTAKQRKTIL